MSADPSQQRPGVVLPDIRPHRFRGGIRNRHQRDGTGSAAGPAGPAPEGPARPVCVSRTGTKQAVCVELLRNGDHRSFSELFSLLGADRDRRAAVESGPASGLQAPLEEQRDKMETLKVHLSRAERAERTGLWAVACDQRLFLGGFFSSPEDVWLRFHFYHSCCQTGRPLRPAAEARACLAELLLQQGDLDQARQQAECYLEQAGDEDWLDSSGRPLRLRVHQSLWRIYSRLADALLTDAPPEGANYSEALMLLHKGQRLATEADNKQMEGEASYQLGLTYQRAGDHDSAKQFFNRCVQIYSVLQDADGQVMAYKAMAKSIERNTTSEPVSPSWGVTRSPASWRTWTCCRELRCWLLSLVLSPSSGPSVLRWTAQVPRPLTCDPYWPGERPAIIRTWTQNVWTLWPRPGTRYWWGRVLIHDVIAVHF
ncbi:tetratricopeptide repeat protein 29 isoform X2 [Antennarius striatus]|uniref:tetratricopeptide repeat protein 29 isoform X2 n=1 Tax=Antennarius striatus TaxID=241820 RepID=UPI0035AFD17B